MIEGEWMMDNKVRTTRIVIERDHKGELRTTVFADVQSTFQYVPIDNLGVERIEYVGAEKEVYPLKDDEAIKRMFDDIANKVDSK